MRRRRRNKKDLSIDDDDGKKFMKWFQIQEKVISLSLSRKKMFNVKT